MEQVRSVLRSHVSLSPDRAQVFFKTAKGDYAEHDKFMGVPVPVLRKLAKTFTHFTLDELSQLISSRVNEERLLALIILVSHYQKADNPRKEAIYQFYLKHLAHVNNWNLVDASAHLIMGAHLWDKDKKVLLALARSENLWERRISIVSTWDFIRKGDVSWTFKIAELLLFDSHDLIHKASGWMLREAGKRDQNQLLAFLDQHAGHMPRTMLRYAIEKFPSDLRQSYLDRRFSQRTESLTLA